MTGQPMTCKCSWDNVYIPYWQTATERAGGQFYLLTNVSIRRQLACIPLRARVRVMVMVRLGGMFRLILVVVYCRD